VAVVKVVGNAHVLGLLTLAEEHQTVQAVDLLSMSDGAVKLSQAARDLRLLGQVGLPGGQGLLEFCHLAGEAVTAGAELVGVGGAGPVPRLPGAIEAGSGVVQLATGLVPGPQARIGKGG
jgi:hypothetical protein